MLAIEIRTIRIEARVLEAGANSNAMSTAKQALIL